jgi:superfamily II DNA/RNA helicase
MIEVGVDVDRLGLLTMFGQPKSSSQYIQVAGRVGRNERDAPGVVFVLLSPGNVRDRSHFEHFSEFHRRLYASVEPVSVTPYTPSALQRGLPGALASLLRLWYAPSGPETAGSCWKDLRDLFLKRVPAGSPEEEYLLRCFAELEAQLLASGAGQWGTFSTAKDKNPDTLLRIQGSRTAEPPSAWEAPNSMRSVEPESGIRFHEPVEAAQEPPQQPKAKPKAPVVEEEEVF